MKKYLSPKDLDKSILKQVIRDIASKNDVLNGEALDFLASEEFSNLCNRLQIDSDETFESIKNLGKYPLLPKKKLAEEMARLLDKF